LPPCIGLTLVFLREPGSVIHIVAENPVTVFAVLSGVKDVLVPELIDFLRRRRKNVVLLFVRERVKEALVVTLHTSCLVLGPAQLFHALGTDRTQVQFTNMLFCQ
jgi:hypothetical protein